MTNAAEHNPRPDAVTPSHPPVVKPPRPIQVVAIASGKGGVGKSLLSLNLAVALAELDRRVLVLDGNMGLGAIDALIGLNPRFTMADVVAERATLEEILIPGPGGIRIVPGAAGAPALAGLSTMQHAAIIGGFSELGDQVDVMVIDTPTGIAPLTLDLVRASHEVLLVASDEPVALRDAHALVHVLFHEHGLVHFKVVANLCRSSRDGQKLHYKLNRLCEQTTDVTLAYAGHVPFDDSVRLAVQRQKTVLEFAPHCRATRAIRSLAQTVDGWPLRTAATGQMEFFVERLVALGLTRSRG